MVLLAAVGALLLAAFGAASQAEAATIYGCVKKKGGTIHIVTKKAKCKKGESKLSWNSEGPAGKNGTGGTNGTNGINGANGTPAGTRFFATDPTSTALHTIATIGALTLQGGCTAGGIPELSASISQTSNNMEDTFGKAPVGNAETTAGTLVSLAEGVPFGGMGTAHFLTYTSHQDIQIEWFVRPSNAFGAGTGCFYSGYVTIL